MNRMEYLYFRGLNTKISRIGFGCSPMGLHQWGNTNEKEMILAVNVALDHGLNFFETADIYGLGKSEEILGKALGNRRENAVISTKFGVRISPDGKTYYDNQLSYLETALEGSLKRLKTDCIDHYQIHYWDSMTPLEEVFGKLEDLVEKGKISCYGISNIYPDAHLTEKLPQHLVSFSLKYSLAFRDDEDLIINIISKFGLAFLSWGSLAEGLLTGKYNTNTSFGENDRRRRPEYSSFHGSEFGRNMKIIVQMKNIQNCYNHVTLSQIAIRWILDTVPNSVALVGAKNSKQVIDNIAASKWKLTADHIGLLDDVA